MKKIIHYCFLVTLFSSTAYAQNAGNIMGYGEGSVIRDSHVNQPLPDNGGVHLKKTMTYTSLPNAVGNASIVGITLGMSAVEAQSALAKHCHGAPFIEYQTLSTTYKNVQVETQPFVNRMSCLKPDDRVELTISPPVAGSIVVKIFRDVSYLADSAPRFSDLQSDVASKYGLHLSPPSRNEKSGATLLALRGGQGVKEIKNQSSDDFNLQEVKAFLSVTAESFSQNPDNISHFTVGAVDFDLKHAAANEVMKQLSASVDDKLSHNTVKPTL